MHDRILTEFHDDSVEELLILLPVIDNHHIYDDHRLDDQWNQMMKPEVTFSEPLKDSPIRKNRLESNHSSSEMTFSSPQ